MLRDGVQTMHLHTPPTSDSDPEPESHGGNGYTASLVMSGQLTTSTPQKPLHTDVVRAHLITDDGVVRQTPRTRDDAFRMPCRGGGTPLLAWIRMAIASTIGVTFTIVGG